MPLPLPRPLPRPIPRPAPAAPATPAGDVGGATAPGRVETDVKARSITAEVSPLFVFRALVLFHL